MRSRDFGLPDYKTVRASIGRPITSLADITTDLVTMMLIFTNPNMRTTTSYSESFAITDLVDHVNQEAGQRRLRCSKDGKLVELKPPATRDFSHLPGLEQSLCYHLFLSRAMLIAQTH